MDNTTSSMTALHNAYDLMISIAMRKFHIILSKIYLLRKHTKRRLFRFAYAMSHGYHYDQATHGWLAAAVARGHRKCWCRVTRLTRHRADHVAFKSPTHLPPSGAELRSIDQWNNSTLFGFAEIIQAGASSRVSECWVCDVTSPGLMLQFHPHYGSSFSSLAPTLANELRTRAPILPYRTHTNFR